MHVPMWFMTLRELWSAGIKDGQGRTGLDFLTTANLSSSERAGLTLE